MTRMQDQQDWLETIHSYDDYVDATTPVIPEPDDGYIDAMAEAAADEAEWSKPPRVMGEIGRLLFELEKMPEYKALEAEDEAFNSIADIRYELNTLADALGVDWNNIP